MRHAEPFQQVLSLDQGRSAEADTALARLQQRERAATDPELGIPLAETETVSRAVLAAALNRKLGLPGRIDSIAYQRHDPIVIPLDIRDHSLREDVIVILNLRLRGFMISNDGAFHPDEPVSRAEFAMVLEDVVMSLTGNRRLAGAYYGVASPFPDIDADAPYFNAVMFCTVRGLVASTDPRWGRFEPHANVRGAEVVVAIRLLLEGLARTQL